LPATPSRQNSRSKTSAAFPFMQRRFGNNRESLLTTRAAHFILPKTPLALLLPRELLIDIPTRYTLPSLAFGATFDLVDRAPDFGRSSQPSSHDCSWVYDFPLRRCAHAKSIRVQNEVRFSRQRLLVKPITVPQVIHKSTYSHLRLGIRRFHRAHNSAPVNLGLLGLHLS
jgi:hypothetical protein